MTLPGALAVVAFAATAALVSLAAPLVAYAGSLALFGVPHALAELRYVDGRFSRRLRASRFGLVLAILAAVVALRSLGLARVISPPDVYVIELGLVAVLAFSVVPDLAAHPGRALLAVMVGVAISTGSFLAPWTTVVVLGILHNLAPVGLLAERLSGTPHLRPAMVACGVLFAGVPALIVTAPPEQLLDGLQASPFASAGSLSTHLPVFVPPALLDSDVAVPLFVTAVYLQLLHYGAVLAVLPRLLGVRGSASDAPCIGWPRGPVLGGGIALCGLAAALLFVRDFPGARALYGLLAAVHAWIEIPALLLALGPRSR